MAVDGEGRPTLDSSACNRGNGVSSFPEDTQEKTRLVGERGVHDAGTRHWTSMVDRLKPHLPTLRSDGLRSLASKPLS